jgi:integrase
MPAECGIITLDSLEPLVPRVAPSTVNKAVKILKVAFNSAVAKRQLEFSPTEYVEGIETAEPSRRPFTDDELDKLLKAATGDKAEWLTMILVAFYTGMRLRDCAGLTWRNVELHTGTINVMTEKTSRRQVLPIAEPLARHLSTLAGDNPDAPLCPGLQGKNSSCLSGEFYNVMVDAGLAEKRDGLSKGKGRDAKREKSQISFHSLRYNTTSALKNAGVNDSVTMDIIGHETAAVSRNYTKIDDAAKRAAIAKMPDITR